MATTYWVIVLIGGGYVSGHNSPFLPLLPHKPQTTSEAGGQGRGTE